MQICGRLMEVLAVFASAVFCDCTAALVLNTMHTHLEGQTPPNNLAPRNSVEHEDLS